MRQIGEEEGEVELVKSKYSTNRFAFSWSWWSAYGWQKKIKKGDKHESLAQDMKLIGQDLCYAAVGKKVKQELYDGNAIVLFAYGLSGSGKTFTVFGPDAVDAPEAWFKHLEPTNMWGVLPNLGKFFVLLIVERITMQFVDLPSQSQSFFFLHNFGC